MNKIKNRIKKWLGIDDLEYQLSNLKSKYNYDKMQQSQEYNNKFDEFKNDILTLNENELELAQCIINMKKETNEKIMLIENRTDAAMNSLNFNEMGD